jgi:hypothetical protein
VVSFLCFDECRRAPVCRRHPHAKHATVERRPCLSLAWSRVSTNPCRAHVVGVVPSPRLCRRHFARAHHHRVEALFFLAEPVHTHSRTREVVRRRMCLINAAGPFLAVPLFFVPLPSARHQFRVAAMVAPSVFGTHTNAHNRGAEPLLHLSVTVLDIPPCRRREPQRTGARVSVKPSTPSSNLLATLTLNTASPKPARRALVSVSSPCTCRRFRVAPVARPPTFAQMRTHTPEGSNPSAFPVQPHTHLPVRTLTLSFHMYSCDPHWHRTRVCVGEPHLAPLCRRREPQRVGTRLFPEAVRHEVEPSWPP